MSIAAEEYLFTFGITLAFVGTIAAAYLSRRDIAAVFREAGFRRKHLYILLLVVFVFAAAELAIVKPTQQLFFDDVIYQSMAQQLIHTGQAVMCNYGTPTSCFSAEVYHEPIGLPFNLAIGFIFFGISRATAYGTIFVTAALGVAMSFLLAFVLFKDEYAALFTGLLMALSPIMLVWAMPTTSDMPMMAYATMALLFTVIFAKRKRTGTFALAAFSLGFLLYMKVDSFAYLLIAPLLYLAIDDRSLLRSLRSNAAILRRNFLNTKFLIVLLIFVIIVAPEVVYMYIELLTGNYGVTSTTYLQNTCNNMLPVQANGTFSFSNLNANICSNVAFWFNAYKSDYVMQPLIFTALAILGAALLAYKRPRVLLFIGVWFVILFFIYVAFYAGGVLYGVDWRFMLALIVQTSLLGGIALSYIAKALMTPARIGMLPRRARTMMVYIAIAICIAIVVWPTYTLVPLLGVQPANIPQANGARFYENFIYNSTASIPKSCIVMSYDPTFFNINGFAAAQLSGPNATSYRSFQNEYGCVVIDYGYWCSTPGNICSITTSGFNLATIKKVIDPANGETFALYRITGVK